MIFQLQREWFMLMQADITLLKDLLKTPHSVVFKMNVHSSNQTMKRDKRTSKKQ